MECHEWMLCREYIRERDAYFFLRSDTHTLFVRILQLQYLMTLTPYPTHYLHHGHNLHAKLDICSIMHSVRPNILTDEGEAFALLPTAAFPALNSRSILRLMPADDEVNAGGVQFKPQ